MAPSKSRKAKRATESSVYTDLVQAARQLNENDLHGVSKPLQSLALTNSQWVSSTPKVLTNRLKLMKSNRKLFGRKMSGVEDMELYGDVDEMFIKREDDTGSMGDEYCFTIAPPYTEKDDEHILYSNPTRRFNSESELHEGKQSRLHRWDTEELVSEKILDRKQVKDVRGASKRLLDFEEQTKLNLEKGGHQNPVYADPVYGTENIKIGNKDSVGGKGRSPGDGAQQPEVDCPYIPTAKIPKGINPADFAHGKEAYQLYLSNKRQLDRIEKSDIEPQISLLRLRLIAKRDNIEEAVRKAREYYSSSYQPRKSLKDRLLRMRDYFNNPDYAGSKVLQKGYSQTDIREKLEALPVYTPWFIHVMTVLQAICMAILCASAGVIPPRLAPERLIVEDIITWSGVRRVEHFVYPNMWAGPSREKLVQGGALYAPCLRNDKHYLLRNALYDAKESELGCCEAAGRGAGTTTEAECEEIETLYEVLEIKWINTTCSTRSKGTGVYVPHDFKPCCLGGKGECVLVSHKHCVILGGTWHISEYEHCSEAMCGRDVCTTHDGDVHKEVTESISQLWRLPLSLLYHEGIIQVILFAILQCYVGIDIERVAGWLRMSAIYTVCGTGGLLMGSVIVPYVPNLGSGGAICGLISIHTGELIQSWRLVSHRAKAIAKVIVLYTIMALLGLFPGVNQFTNVGGSILGALCSLALMPYIPFTRQHHQLMLALRIASCTGIILFIAFLLYSFYVTQPNLTGNALYANCLTFVEYACATDLP